MAETNKWYKAIEEIDCGCKKYRLESWIKYPECSVTAVTVEKTNLSLSELEQAIEKDRIHCSSYFMKIDFDYIPSPDYEIISISNYQTELNKFCNGNYELF